MQIKKEKLSKYTSLRVGGLAKIFTPNSVEELQEFLKNNTKKFIFLGLGSNTLFDDEYFDRVIIRTKNLNQVDIKNNFISVYCGTTLHKLAKICLQNNQSGANFLATIPGSVGGALQMNAGCFGREIWEGVQNIKTIDNYGNINQRSIDDFKISYRKITTKHPNEYFLSADFKFNNIAIDENILNKRYKTQPIGTGNCGSVFKNPKGFFAAKLIEDSDLKGYQIGDAQVSEKHANFIINQGSASANDIKKLIKHIQKIVKNKFNIDLETEVQIY